MKFPDPVLQPLAGHKLVLSKTGRPVYLYTANNSVSGKQFAERLAPLDRKHASFVSTSTGGAGATFNLPPAWEGANKGESEGSVALADGKPIWKLLQLWPPDWNNSENFRPMVWTGTDWNVKEGGFGGQPGARLEGRTLNLATRAPHGNPPQWRACAVSFVAPKDGAYALNGEAACRIWDGKNKTALHLLRKTAGGVTSLGTTTIEHGKSTPLTRLTAQLAAGDELILLPQIDGMFAGGDCKLKDFAITLGGAASASASEGTTYRLPASWEGVKKGSAEGNPISARGRPIWRIDQLWPDNPIMAEAYTPMPWSGTEWKATQHEQGGQPAARIQNGSFHASVRGPWTGNEGQKTCALVFIAPQSGLYVISGAARSKPWEGGAKTFKLGLFKRDTQRAAPFQTIELPRDGLRVPLNARLELTAGHELVFLPLMPDWHNATTTTLDELVIQHQVSD